MFWASAAPVLVTTTPNDLESPGAKLRSALMSPRGIVRFTAVATAVPLRFAVTVGPGVVGGTLKTEGVAPPLGLQAMFTVQLLPPGRFATQLLPVIRNSETLVTETPVNAAACVPVLLTVNACDRDP